MAVIGAGAVVVAPTVRPPAPPAPEVRPAAATSAISASAVLLATDPAGQAASATLLPGSALLADPTASSPGNTIKDIYNAVEPWVAYAVDLSVYALGWVGWIPDIPYLGYATAFSGQIYIAYDFGEMIVQSIVFNFADLIDGVGDIWQNLADIATDTVNAFGYLISAELAYWLPPLPPLPPIFGATSTLRQETVNLGAPQSVPDRTPTSAELVSPAGTTAVGATDAGADEQASPEPPTGAGKSEQPLAGDALDTAKAGSAEDTGEKPADAVRQPLADATTDAAATLAAEADSTAHNMADQSNDSTRRAMSEAPETKATTIVAAQGQVRAAVATDATDAGPESSSDDHGTERQSAAEPSSRLSDERGPTNSAKTSSDPGPDADRGSDSDR